MGEYDPKMIQTIKKEICPGASNEELYMFLQIASMYDLNPFMHEIWFVKVRTGNMIMTSRDGFLKIASRNPNFLKVQSFAVYSNDEFKTEVENGEVKSVTHNYGLDRGKLVGAYAFLKTRDGKQDLYASALFKRYNKGNQVWKNYPEAMIRKVAEADVLKRFAKIDGLVTYEEMGYPAKNQELEYQEPDDVIDIKVNENELESDKDSVEENKVETETEKEENKTEN